MRSLHRKDCSEGVGTYYAGPPTILFPAHGRKLRIGKYCSIASNVTIFLGGNHHADWVTTALLRGRRNRSDVYSRGGVTIGNDVWIGHGATILNGVTIGDGAVIGAMAVVASDVEPYAIVVGNPARAIRLRFPPQIVSRLLAVRWWDWPRGKILEARDLLMSGDVEKFLLKYEG